MTKCKHDLWVDALQMIETDHYGLLARPVKACLKCNEILLELPKND